MKVSIDAQLLLEEEKTGIAWYAKKVIEELQKKKIELEFNFFCGRKDNYKLEKLKKEMHIVDSSRIHNCSKMSLSVFRILSSFFPISYAGLMKLEADAVIFFNYVIPSGASGKKIAMIHDMTYKACPQTIKIRTWLWLTLTLPKTCRRADCILTASEFSKNEIMKYLRVKETKIKVLSCGVDRDVFHIYSVDEIQKAKKENLISGEYYLYVGTLEPRKNLERLIKAYYVCSRRKKSIPKLVLAGRKGWMYEGIYKLIHQLRLERRVILTGYLERKEIAALMSGAKIFLYPSLYEGFGMPPLEAMACRTAVLTSNTASLPEVVGRAGILVDPYSIREISRGIMYLENNDTARLSYAEKGYRRSRQFTWSRAGERLCAVLKELDKERGMGE